MTADTKYRIVKPPAPDFWGYAHQVAAFTRDRHKAYEALKKHWLACNRDATHVLYEQAMKRIADIVGV